MHPFIVAIHDPGTYGPIAYAGVLVFLFIITSRVYAKFSKSKSGFGTVFNSITGKPIDLARVRLIDIHGLTVASAVTDEYGHYRLTGMPGEFMIAVSKPGFVFPSIFLKSANKSKKFENIIRSQKIKIRDYGIITKNIPMDPLQGMKNRSKVFSRWIVLSDNAQIVISVATPLIAWIYPFISGQWIHWLFFTIYTVANLLRIISFRPAKPQFGTVKDAQTGKPLERVILRLFDSKFNRVLNTQVTTAKGRYAFLVNQGSYYMALKKDGYRTLRINFPDITKNSYPLATDVQMKPSIENEIEERT